VLLGNQIACMFNKGLLWNPLGKVMLESNN